MEFHQINKLRSSSFYQVGFLGMGHVRIEKISTQMGANFLDVCYSKSIKNKLTVVASYDQVKISKGKRKKNIICMSIFKKIQVRYITCVFRIKAVYFRYS